MKPTDLPAQCGEALKEMEALLSKAGQGSEECHEKLSRAVGVLRETVDALLTERDQEREERSLAEREMLESREHYRMLVDSVNFGVYRNTADLPGKFFYVNRALADLLGYTVDELVGTPVAALYERPEERKALLRKVREQGVVEEEEIRLRRKDGSLVWASCSAVAKRNGQGEILWMDGGIKDITASKKAQQALRESEDRYRRLVDLMPDAMTVIADEKLVYSNAAAARVMGAESPEDLSGLSVWDLLPPESAPLAKELMARVLDGGETVIGIELPLLRADGGRVEAEISGGPTLYRGGKAIQTVTRDITERKAAREALRKAHDQLEERVEARTAELRQANAALQAEIAVRRRAEAEIRDTRNYLRTVIHNSHDGILVVDAEERFEFANTAFFRTAGRREKELIGEHFIKIIPPDLHKHIMARWAEVQARAGRPYEIDIVRKSGERRSLLVSHTDMTIRGERKYCVITKDVTKRKKAEKALAEQRLVFEETLQQAANGIVVCDREGRFTFANAAALRMVRRDPIGSGLGVVAKAWGKVYSKDGNSIPNEELTIAKALRGERTVGRDLHLVRDDGSSYDLLVSAAPLKNPDGAIVGAVATFADITARIRAERELDRHRNHLEEMVQKRTAELSEANVLLHNEVAERVAIEQSLRNAVRRLRELEAIVNRSPAVVFRWRVADGWPVEFVSGNVQQFGYSANDLMSGGVSWPGITHPEDVPRLEAELKRRGDEGKTEFTQNYRILTAWGEYRWIEDRTQALFDGAGALTHYQGVIFDVTERVAAQERAHDYQRQLQSMASQSALAEERERRRIAEELHDNIGQNLAMAQIKVSQARHSDAAAERDRSLEDAASFIKASIDCTRHHTFELSSPVLHERGLQAGLEALVQRMNKQHEPEILFEGDFGGGSPSKDGQLVLYRAVRELIVNAVKHARADRVKVSVSGDGLQVRIVVEDDGVGFDPDEVFRFKPDGGFGLFSVRERLSHMGGAMRIESGAGDGARVTMSMDLAPEEAS